MLACLTLVTLGVQGQTPQVRSRLAPALTTGSDRPTTYRLQVTSREALEECLRKYNISAKVYAEPRTPQLLLISGLNAAQLRELAACPAVKYIDQGNRQPTEEAELRNADLSANHIPAVHSQYPQLMGQGLVASVKERPFDPADLDLRGRTIAAAEASDGYSPHATTMATYIAGAGNSGPLGLGVAPGAKLTSSSMEELLPDPTAQLLQAGVSVQNHSYGVGVENYYGLEAQAYDAQVIEAPQLLHVFSSGNSGGEAGATGKYAGIPGFANLTGQFKQSKNSLSVGALDPDGSIGARSSKGPAYDGRVKPELTAYGKGGTSEAAAVVSGIALLVQQAYREQHESQLPPASLVKAILINSADDVGRPEVDFEAGFGNANALSAIRTTRNRQYITENIAQGQELTFRISVPAGVRRLKATLVWHDPAAEAGEEQALIHDLDLSLRQAATGQVWEPWVLSAYAYPDSLRQPARRGKDRINNVEQVTLASPKAGVYELQVQGHRVLSGRQPFALVYTFETDAEWKYPVAGSSLIAGQVNRIRWQGMQQGNARLEYRIAGNDVWQLIAEGVDATTFGYDWQAPDTVAEVQVRLSMAGEVLESDTFLLSKPLPLTIGYACPGQVMVHWPQLSADTQYQVYKLGEAYLEPLALLSDTLLVLGEEQLQALSPGYLAVAPVVAGKTGMKSISVNYEEEGAACYVASFLATSYVTDQVVLELQLSSTHQLASLTLERLDDGSFRPLKSVSPVNAQDFKLEDSSPGSGKNVYRVKLTTASGLTFYSQPEEVVHTGAGQMLVYPNPVEAGQPLFIALSSETAQVELVDKLGRLLYRGTREGMVKEISTLQLQAGLYLIRVRTEKGDLLVERVQVR